MMHQKFIITSPQELQSLIQTAVTQAVSQISFPQKVDPLPDFLSLEETAQFLNLAKPTIYGMVSRKQIPFIKKTKKLYFSKNALERWLEERKNNLTI